MKEIIVVGGFNEVFESLEENGYNIIGYIDHVQIKSYNQYQWLGSDLSIKKYEVPSQIWKL